MLYAFITAMLTAVSCTNDIPANVTGDTSEIHRKTHQKTHQKAHPAVARVICLVILVKFPLPPVLPLKRVLHNWEVMEAAVLKKEIRCLFV